MFLTDSPCIAQACRWQLARCCSANCGFCPGGPPRPAAPTTEERLAALEAYVNNTDPGPALAGVPGPGHNAWMMTCAALVLFMTLPGLALFYGGLVRRKNVLSVLAQCLGIAGLVTILWWAVRLQPRLRQELRQRRSSAARNSSSCTGVDLAPRTPDYSLLGVAERLLRCTS